ncbi:GAF and ANTAR domain-containing protein [Rhodococcus sp. CH91]|uniref:GAF and ANTAR domain-containing protein n=1 Tax=Rhodococcus sp. CH91 TaxID=2910256 RepID=UPI001F4B3B67|nr:GAF and ANTAR domain-containing protein [Rhodococcus sp. CH91]
MGSSIEPGDLGRRIAQLARGFYRPADLDETLRGVTAAAVELVGGAECADILIVTDRKHFRSLAATSELAEHLDDLQEQFGEGPCLDASFKYLVVRSEDLREERRWPHFAKAAVDAGVLSALSFQLYLEQESMGALNMFSSEADAFGPGAEAIAEVLAAHAAMAMSAARSRGQFASALATRDVIGQAKGMIMERFGIDAVAAFELLRKLSQDSNVPLATVAQRIVEAGPEPRGDDRRVGPAAR